MVENPLYNESTSHVEVTAQHSLDGQKLHIASLKHKISQHEHIAHGLISREITHHEKTQKYQERYKFEHHHE